MESSSCLKQTEIMCVERIPSLAMWIIEYAWSHRMMDVLEGLAPFKGLEVDLQSLALQEPRTLRVAAAQAWSVVNARDVEHFESVLELLEVIHTLVPRLVSAIKHMKIMFGLKTMIVMWLLRMDQEEVSTMKKLFHFFPSRLSLYHGCSKRELDQMRQTHHEFKQLAQTLLLHKDMCKAYIRDLMEEEYGERYAQKLEERLFDYLQLLEKDLPPTTCIDQVLRQERPLLEGEQLLLKVLSCSPACLPSVLKRLLHFAKAALHTSPRMGKPSCSTDTKKDLPQPLKDSKDQTLPPTGNAESVRSHTNHSSCMGCVGEKAMPDPPCSTRSCLGDQNGGAKQTDDEQGSFLGGHGDSHGWVQRKLVQDESQRGQKEQCQGLEERRLSPRKDKQSWTKQHCQIGDYPLQLCSKHQRWVRNTLQGCSEELGGQSNGIAMEYPREVLGASVHIIGQCLRDTGEQSVVEQCSENVERASGRLVGHCTKELEGESMTLNILETCSQESGDLSGSVDHCTKELQRQSVSILEQCANMVGCQNAGVMDHHSKEEWCQTVSVEDQSQKKMDSQRRSIIEQCLKDEGCQTCNIIEQCPKDEGCQTGDITEQCPKDEGCQTGDITEQCPKDEGCQTGDILEQCPTDEGCQTGDILEQCPTDEGCQTGDIIEQCLKDEGCQTGDIIEHCMKEEVACANGSNFELCSDEMAPQIGSILEQCPKEMESQGGSILEQCPKPKGMGSQNGNTLEKCPKDMGSQNGGIIKHCPKGLRSQNGSILEQCSEEVGSGNRSILQQDPAEMGSRNRNLLGECKEQTGSQHGSILQPCPTEMGSQESGGILKDWSCDLLEHSAGVLDRRFEDASWNPGVTELQQELPLSLVRSVTPSQQRSTPRRDPGWSHGTAGSLPGVDPPRRGVRISLESQLLLIRSWLLQPTVRVRRLSLRECHLAAGSGGTEISCEEEEEVGREDEENEGEEHHEQAKEGELEDWESDFTYSESDSEGFDSDPDYKPVHEKRLQF